LTRSDADRISVDLIERPRTSLLQRLRLR
jgi:hypothetical protein